MVNESAFARDGPVPWIGVRAEIPQQVIAFVRNVLGSFGEIVKDSEDLDVAARIGSGVLSSALAKTTACGLFRKLDARVGELDRCAQALCS